MIRKILESHWFAPTFALVQTLRHVGMVVSAYFSASLDERHFNALEFIRGDLERPFFEPFGFCGVFFHYDFAQSAVLGLDLPIYAIATILHSAMTAHASCFDSLTSPRGHIVTATLALPVWFLAGLELRRLGLRRWRRPVSSMFMRYMLYLILPTGVLGGLFVALSAAALLVSDLGSSVRLLGLGLWLAWLGLLSAERLRVWPFASLLPKEYSR